MYSEWFVRYAEDIYRCIADDTISESGNLRTLDWPETNRNATLNEVEMKISHTFMVRDHCKEIAQWLRLSEHDIKLATIIGLFHDLGRFNQALWYGTMNDRITGSHGDMSVEVFLKDAPHTGMSDYDKHFVTEALRYHNHFKIPDNLSPRAKLFTKLVRDADKMDIFRFYTNKEETSKFRFIIVDGEGERSPELVERLLQGKNLHINELKNPNDRVLMQISLVYDLNFGYSCQWLLEKGYLAKLTGVFDGTADPAMKKVHEYAENWLRERVNVGINCSKQ